MKELILPTVKESNKLFNNIDIPKPIKNYKQE